MVRRRMKPPAFFQLRFKGHTEPGACLSQTYLHCMLLQGTLKVIQQDNSDQSRPSKHASATISPNPFSVILANCRRKQRAAQVKYEEIQSRVESLRRELTEIGQRNRRYLTKKRHSREEQEQHRRLQDRVQMIRIELQALLERTKTA
jgi:hypothetical protein